MWEGGVLLGEWPHRCLHLALLVLASWVWVRQRSLDRPQGPGAVHRPVPSLMPPALPPSRRCFSARVAASPLLCSASPWSRSPMWWTRSSASTTQSSPSSRKPSACPPGTGSQAGPRQLPGCPLPQQGCGFTLAAPSLWCGVGSGPAHVVWDSGFVCRFLTVRTNPLGLLWLTVWRVHGCGPGLLSVRLWGGPRGCRQEREPEGGLSQTEARKAGC